MSAGLTASVSYTWSHAISNTPEGNTYEFSNAVEDPTNPLRDRGNSSINRPNALTASVVYQPVAHFDSRIWNGLANGNNIAFLANMSSGDEQTITTSSKINGDALATSRPLFVGRNTVTTPPIYQYDAALHAFAGHVLGTGDAKADYRREQYSQPFECDDYFDKRYGRYDSAYAVQSSNRHDNSSTVVCEVEHAAGGSDSTVWFED